MQLGLHSIHKLKYVFGGLKLLRVLQDLATNNGELRLSGTATGAPTRHQKAALLNRVLEQFYPLPS